MAQILMSKTHVTVCQIARSELLSTRNERTETNIGTDRNKEVLTQASMSSLGGQETIDKTNLVSSL